jgi:putative cell wall-binding protein
MPPAHLTVPLSDSLTGVMCQYCHMPSTIPSGLTLAPPESSHLFRAVMPSKSLSTASVGWNLFPAGVTSTTPSPQPGSPLPDDSCTGALCHPQSDTTKNWLQDIITTRQTAIINKLAQAEALRIQASVVASNTVLYQKARTNLLMVRNDGSWGIHNYYYANSLLDWSINAYESMVASPSIPGVVPVSRWWGPTRYETAVAISERSFPAFITSDAIIVTGQNYPDALSASALAGSVHGPILLTQTSSLPPSTDTELARLGVKNAWIVGGTGVVSPSVATELQSLVGGTGTVTRVQGADRYATSAAVAGVVASREGAGFNHEVFLATGQNFPDALSCSPYAYSRKAPVLLTQTAALPAPTAAALAALGITRVTIAGGTGAVSSQVATATESITGTGTTFRIAGQDRYNTATLMTDYATFNGWATRAFVGVASGQNYPDALTGGPAVGRRNGVMLLTTSASLSRPAAAWLYNAQLPPAEVKAAALFGGSGAVSDTVWAQVYSLLNP